MDDTKDIQVSNLSKFLDVEVRTNPFGENHSGERAYRRAERLVAALFLLTNHLGSDEPLRADVRKAATSLLPQILALRDDMRSIGSKKISQFQATVRLLISFIKMLLFSGSISSQNADAASGALDDLANFVTVAQRSPLSENIKLSRDNLADVHYEYKGQIKDIRDKQLIKDKLSVKDVEHVSDTTHTQMSSRNAPTPPRAQRIMAILRAGTDFNIRDIAANLPEYSEKTIQREIATLVERGLVRRTGLKRWSRYSIV